MLAERRQDIERDLGGVEHLSALQRGLVSRYLEHELVADPLGHNIATQGPLTSKGKQRAALSAYLAVAAQQMRIAQALGLERRHRSVGSPLDYINGKVDA